MWRQVLVVWALIILRTWTFAFDSAVVDQFYQTYKVHDMDTLNKDFLFKYNKHKFLTNLNSTFNQGKFMADLTKQFSQLTSHSSSETDNTPSPKNVTVAFAHVSNSLFKSSSGSLFKIVPVSVAGPKSKINVYALLDDGTSATLIDKEVADFVGAKGPSNTISVNGVGGMSKISKINLVNIEIKGLHCNESFKLKNIGSIPNLDTIRQVVRIEDLAKFSYLYDITKELSYDEAIPSLIIGIDNHHLLLPRELRRGGKNEPAAIRTALGWTIFGKVSATPVETVLEGSRDPRVYSIP